MKYMITAGMCIVWVCWGCGNPKQKQETQLEEEVTAIHDSIMPKMGAIRDLKKSLLEVRQSWKQDTTQSLPQAQTMTRQIHRLDSAHQSMMQWMRQYKPPADSLTHQEAMEYLKTQKEAINEVKLKMLKELHRSDSLLQIYQ